MNSEAIKYAIEIAINIDIINLVLKFIHYIIAALLILIPCVSFAENFLDDPALLSSLEKRGFGFGELVFKENVSTNKELLNNKLYHSLVSDIASDLADAKRKDSKLGVTMRSVHRLFDVEWLKSERAFFELVGIVNRLDRAPFAPKHCGEIRFIYRLAYRTAGDSSIYSRLPMTVNAVYWIPKMNGNCQAGAQSWNAFESDFKKGEIKNLSFSRLNINELKSIEINLQSVRWPSTIRPDMGGYAEYLLRAYKISGDVLKAGALENTPDVVLASNETIKHQLFVWLTNKTNLKAIDSGVVLIPDEFLATKTTSVALHGVHRLQNAPFTQIFKEADFSQLDFAEFKTFKTGHGLLRRLNDLTCTGCHQGRTIAGFHFLGKDRPGTDSVNAIASAASPHFFLDQKRRSKFMSSITSGRAPAVFRPISVRAQDGEGGSGSHCGLGDDSFEDWECISGYECKALTRDSLVSRSGVCVPKRARSGSACIPGNITANSNPHRDEIKLSSAEDCGDSYFCQTSQVGFPGGMCSGSCSRLRDGEACGSIAVLKGFNDCLAARKKPFSDCLRENVNQASLQSCSDSSYCRDDYICAASSSGGGICIPPYFLFQLRVDGHPSP